MIVLFLERQELQGWIAGFLKKFMTISFFYALLINQSTWFPAIINSFVQIGQQAGGVSAFKSAERYWLRVCQAPRQAQPLGAYWESSFPARGPLLRPLP
jgi:hypothetical protein